MKSGSDKWNYSRMKKVNVWTNLRNNLLKRKRHGNYIFTLNEII